jgi:hypothetical protein
MKQNLFVASIIILAALLSSCDKNKGGEETTKRAQIATFTESDQGADWADIYTYTWTDGKVTKVERTGLDGSLNRTFTFAYSGNNLIVTCDKHEGAPAYTYYTITLNDKGFIASLADEWETYTYTYNADNRITHIDRDGSPRSDIVIEAGNIMSWSKLSDGAWVTKAHAYSTDKNVAGIHNIYSEQGGCSRWFYETGLLGKGTENLCTSNQWSYSDKGSTLTYAADNDNNVTRETKTYDGWKEYYDYSWTIIEE